MKIYHIHTDPKFINDSLHFDFEDYNNTIVYVGDSVDVKNQTTFPFICIPNTLNVVTKISKICKDAQMIVLYDLSTEKIALANKLPKNIKILWRFFGHELYSRKQKDFLSDNSLELLKQQKTSLFNKVRNLFSFKFKRLARQVVFKDNYNFEQAIKRIDIFLCLFEEEFKILKTIFKGLPEFVQIPIFKTEIKLELLDHTNNKNKLIIGNSRNVYNNHIDILEITQNHKTLNLVLPFNYGSKSLYSRKVEEIALSQNVKVIKDFMPYDAYAILLKDSAAFILNSYRQMAVGNVLIAIESGMKLYINKKNIVYKVLKDHHFHVFTIEDFKHDISLKNLHLSEKEVVHNFKVYNTLCKKYTLQNFKINLETKLCNIIDTES